MEGSSVATGVSSEDVANLFSKVSGSIPASLKKTRRNKRAATDMVITVSNPSLSFPTMSQMLGAYGGDVKLSNLKKSLDGASLSIPYTTEASNLISQVGAKFSSAFTSTLTFSSDSSCSDIVSAINTAGKNSIVNIDLDSTEALLTFDGCIPEMYEAATSVVGTNFSVILSGASATSGMSTLSLKEDQPTSLSKYTFDEDTLTGPLYITPNTVTVIVVAFMFIIAALIGLNCTMNIQTPVRYANPSMVLAHTKEY